MKQSFLVEIYQGEIACCSTGFLQKILNLLRRTASDI